MIFIRFLSFFFLSESRFERRSIERGPRKYQPSRIEKEGRHVREWMRWSLSLLANDKHTMRASECAWILDLECICKGWCECE